MNTTDSMGELGFNEELAEEVFTVASCGAVMQRRTPQVSWEGLRRWEARPKKEAITIASGVNTAVQEAKIRFLHFSNVTMLWNIENQFGILEESYKIFTF